MKLIKTILEKEDIHCFKPTRLNKYDSGMFNKWGSNYLLGFVYEIN
ncbi:hypothetical protein JA1_0069 [Vibrio phage JA-1]|uniref:Uncharacterized protein n=1 Tax=Vibrio phage JA-1 TaxID=1283071 RepID=R9R4T2_9CAUD|nr:hypothetical protein M612_gp34 [Vibrio phage JA-1]AGI61821.1 hypothetical protein JA1_0069 [Vibrio phage JA-1]